MKTMSPTLAAQLRAAVARYLQTNDDFHLEEWCKLVEVLAVMRATDFTTPTYLHLY